MSSTLVVGIDLGTTHCALAFAPLSTPDARVEVLPIEQLVAPGAVERRPLLPSFLYFAHESEAVLPLPWDAERRFAVGELARARGAEAPERVISSAKSWLSYGGVDRRSGNLPLNAPSDIERISPVEASFRLLDHLNEAFRAARPQDGDLSAQEVVLTVPGPDRRGGACGRLRSGDPARGATSRAVCVDRTSGRGLAHAPARGRSRARDRHRRRDDGFFADRRGGAGRLARAAARRGGRPHLARGRQHGFGARPHRWARADGSGQRARSFSAQCAGARLPQWQREAALRRGARASGGRAAGSRITAAGQHAAGRATAAANSGVPARWLLPTRGRKRAAEDASALRPDPSRAAVRQRPRHHPPPGGGSGAARLHQQRGRAPAHGRSVQRGCTQGRRVAPARTGHAQRLAGRAGSSTGPGAARRRPRLGGSTRRRLLRSGPPR
jgi:hypothetical protein